MKQLQHADSFSRGDRVELIEVRTYPETQGMPKEGMKGIVVDTYLRTNVVLVDFDNYGFWGVPLRNGDKLRTL